MTDRDFEHVTHFPVKLWDVVNDEDNDIFRWSDDGRAFYVDDHKYEAEIMEKYPGFVQISSFANLRRLLREYSFDWQNNELGEFQFSHVSFERGKRDGIFDIRTKRKSIQACGGQPVKNRRRIGDSSNPANAAKAWMQPTSSGKVNLRVDTLMRFPEKFWAVVNDTNDMLYWGENGDTIIVDDKKYEEGIMGSYPGFVQINSFANLRRLLREYGFSWSIRDNGFFEFSHSHMKRGRQDLLKGVKTKRKAMKAGTPHPYLPFYRGDGPYTSPGSKMFSPTHSQYDQYEQGLSTRSSPEVDQAIGSIQTPPHEHQRHFHHHHGSGDHPMPHMYGFPQYRLMSPYTSIPSPVGIPPPSWPLPMGTGKMEPSFFYPAWSHDNQLPLPMPCEQSAFGTEDQISPETDPKGSSSEMRASSTGSSESVYASTSKGSPHTQNDDQIDISSQETTPCAAFPMIHLPSEDSFNASMDHGSTYNPPCEQEIYQPSYQSVSANDTLIEHEEPKIKSECPDIEEIHISIDRHETINPCLHEVGNKDELNNNNEFKTVCPEGTMMQMMNSSLTPEQPQNQLLSNTEQLAMECGAKVAETIISR